MRPPSAELRSRCPTHRVLLAPLLVAACAAPPPADTATDAPTTESITVEWVYGPEPAAIGRMPQRFWRADGNAILLDPRQPDERRTFELLDPETLSRTPLVDTASALGTLREILGNDAPSELRWPIGFDENGARALYLLQGDVFVLDLASARFHRLTKTPAAEKAAQLSPDGHRVAFVRDNDLHVVEIDSGTETRLTEDGTETTLNGTLSWVYWEEIFGRRDIGYWWAPDSSAIAYLQTDESPVTEVTFVHFLPAVPQLIKQRYPKAGTTNPPVRVGVVELAGAQTTWVQLDPKGFEYVARVKWLPDARRLSVQTMTRDQRQLDLHFADRATGSTHHVLTETDPGWVNIHDDLDFLRDGRHFVWASERDGFEHLYLYTLEGELVRQLTQGPWSVRSSNDAVFWLRRAVTAIDEEAGWLYFSALEKSSVERHLYRVRLDGTGMERLSKEDGSHAIAFSPDARFYFDEFSDIYTPPALGLHAADGRKLSVLAAANTERLARWDVQCPELFTIPADDGFEMPAQILKPRDFDPGQRYPVIVNIYAGPSAPTVQNAWQFGNYFDQVLLQAGYLVCKVDNRSATAISKKLENTILLQSGGDSELNDLVAAARWLKQQPFVDPDRIGVWGWSGGGSTTLLLMTRSQEFRAGIAVAPVTDWHYYDTKWAEATMKTPQDNRDGYRHTSLVRRAGDLHGRLLLVHGTYDDNVHPQNAWHFVDALVRAGVDFDMMFYPMRKHSIADRPARVHLFKKMVEFWKLRL